MKIFLDTADIQEIEDFANLGLVDGVTTNPSLIHRSGKDFKSTIKTICGLVDGPVSAEVVAMDYDGMLREAEVLRAIADNVCIKLPTTAEGVRACRSLTEDGALVNMTLCFSVTQALAIAKAGGSFVSPFVGRLDDMQQDGMALVEDIRTVYDQYDMQTEILAASIRTVEHIRQAALIGADVATLPPKLLTAMLKHPLTDKGLEAFLADWQSTGQSIV